MPRRLAAGSWGCNVRNAIGLSSLKRDPRAAPSERRTVSAISTSTALHILNHKSTFKYGAFVNLFSKKPPVRAVAVEKPINACTNQKMEFCNSGHAMLHEYVGETPMFMYTLHRSTTLSTASDQAQLPITRLTPGADVEAGGSACIPMHWCASLHWEHNRQWMWREGLTC